MLKVPGNLDRFFYDYSHSKFIECNRQMALQNFERLNGTYHQNSKRNTIIKPCFYHIANELEMMYKNYWLSAGTLLGIENSRKKKDKNIFQLIFLN